MLTLLLYMLSTLKGMCRRIALITISQSVPLKADRIPLILIMIFPLYYPPSRASHWSCFSFFRQVVISTSERAQAQVVSLIKTSTLTLSGD